MKVYATSISVIRLSEPGLEAVNFGCVKIIFSTNQMENLSDHSVKKELPSAGKVWQITAIICLFITILLIFRVAFNIILMAFAGVLIAVYFRGLAEFLEKKLKLSSKLAYVISVAGSLLILVLLIWFIGNTIQQQASELSDAIPNTVNTTREKLSHSIIGQRILKSSSGEGSQKLLNAASKFFSTGFGFAGDIYIIVFFAIYFAADPSLYKKGILSLFPRTKKNTGEIMLQRIGTALKGWLKSKLISMVLISILLAGSLALVGLPVTIVLGLFAGILEIIPNFGPIVAMIPGVLLAITISTKKAVIVAMIYIVCQTLVGGFVKPLIEKKIIHLPPAVTFLSQLIMGILAGVLGIILAVPILSVIIILIDELYVKKNNSELHTQ
jgi:predicted PurR-regulated permease PerM